MQVLLVHSIIPLFMAAIAAGFRANKRDSNNNLLAKAQCAFDQTSLQCLAVKKQKQKQKQKN